MRGGHEADPAAQPVRAVALARLHGGQAHGEAAGHAAPLADIGLHHAEPRVGGGAQEVLAAQVLAAGERRGVGLGDRAPLRFRAVGDDRFLHPVERKFVQHRRHAPRFLRRPALVDVDEQRLAAAQAGRDAAEVGQVDLFAEADLLLEAAIPLGAGAFGGFRAVSGVEPAGVGRHGRAPRRRAGAPAAGRRGGPSGPRAPRPARRARRRRRRRRRSAPPRHASAWPARATRRRDRPPRGPPPAGRASGAARGRGARRRSSGNCTTPRPSHARLPRPRRGPARKPGRGWRRRR